MAEVTVATGFPKRTVAGRNKVLNYKISTIANTGDVLTIKALGVIEGVSSIPATNLTTIAPTNRSGSTAAYLTFTTGGAVSDLWVTVWGC